MTAPSSPAPSLKRAHIDRLADAQHEIWSHWMRWFFDNDTPENRERWKRQMVTPYADLTESEKESDRKVVREFMPWLAPPQAEAVRHICNDCDQDVQADNSCGCPAPPPLAEEGKE